MRGCVHAGGRHEFLLGNLEIRGGEAEEVSAALAAAHDAVHRERRAEQLIGFVEAPFVDQLADARARDALAVVHGQRFDFERAVRAFQHAARERDVAGALFAETPVAADHEQTRAQFGQQHVLEERSRTHLLDALVERQQEEHVETARIEQVDLLRHGGQRFGCLVRVQIGERMVFERQGAGQHARLTSAAQTLEHRAMANVHAVKDADRQEKIGVCVISVEITDDLHRRLSWSHRC